MAVPVLLPKQGNTVETCLLLEWKKKKGDEIKKGEVICEVETDKAVFELESTADGILLDVFFNEGDDIPVLTNIAVIGSKGESYDEYLPKEKIVNKNRASGEELPEKEKTEIGGKEFFESTGTEIEEPLEQKISPRAKSLAEKYKISTGGIRGTGPGNRIIERDILNKIKDIEPLTNAAGDRINNQTVRPESGSGIGNRVTSDDLKNIKQKDIRAGKEDNIKVVPLKGIRKIIAERMLESLQNSAQLTLTSSAEATALLNLRKRYKESISYKEFQTVTINDLVHYAVIEALLQNSGLNSLLVGDKIEYYENIHLGFAVDTQRGLMVPVIKNSQELNLLQLSHEAGRLAAASISGKIDPEELNGATFTVTNLGSFGIESFTPVLNLPQTAILGVNTISLKPVNKRNEVKFIPHISFSLTVDHRAIDGAAAARFLQSLAKTISEIDLAITKDKMRS